METIEIRGIQLRPVGTIAAPEGISGHTWIGDLLIDPDGMFWASHINKNGDGLLFPISDEHAAKQCISLGVAPVAA